MLLLPVLLLIPVAALGETSIALQAFDKAKRLYANGQYELAKEKFKYCLDYSGGMVKTENINEYIADCDKEINARLQARNAAIKRAARAKAAEKAAFEAAQRKRREASLIKIGTDVSIFEKDFHGAYEDVPLAVKGALTEAGYRLTDDTNAARWSVYVTAYAYEDDRDEKPDLNGTFTRYWAGVKAHVRITDEMEGLLLYENEVVMEPDRDDWHTSYDKAAALTFKKLKKEIGKIIVERINQYR